MFTVFTYIVPILRTQIAASTTFVTAMLVIYGVGLTVGNWIGGKYGDRSVDKTIAFALSALVALFVIFALGMRVPIVAALIIFPWGVASFAVVPALQMRVMEQAGSAPNLAAALNIGAFNLGNAIGAAVESNNHANRKRFNRS